MKRSFAKPKWTPSNKKTRSSARAAEEAKAVIDAVRAELPGLMEQFQGRMAGEIDEAKRILTNQSQKLSVEIAEKVLGRSLR